MNRFRTAAGLTAAAAVITTAGLFGGTAQANAVPFTQSVSIGPVVSTAGDLGINAWRVPCRDYGVPFLCKGP